jgi:hypothetical protein
MSPGSTVKAKRSSIKVMTAVAAIESSWGSMACNEASGLKLMALPPSAKTSSSTLRTNVSVLGTTKLPHVGKTSHFVHAKRRSRSSREQPHRPKTPTEDPAVKSHTSAGPRFEFFGR